MWRDGSREWWVDGKRHRPQGPAVVNADGSYRWYLNGLLHRIGGPAVEAASGARAWYEHGELHREDGPAVEGSDGTREWHNRAIQLSEQEFMAKHGLVLVRPKPPMQTPLYVVQEEDAIKSVIVAMRNKYYGEGSSRVKIRW